MAALKAVGWGVALAFAGLGLGFLYVWLFPGEAYGGFEGIVPPAIGMFAGAAVGVIASSIASMSSRQARDEDSRMMAIAMVVPPVVLGVFAAGLQALKFGVDIIPASLILGTAGGIGTGLAWAYSRRRGMRAHPAAAVAVWVVLAVTAWLLGKALGAGTGNENSLHPEFFFYLTLIVPLQIAAPVSAAVLPIKNAVSRA